MSARDALTLIHALDTIAALDTVSRDDKAAAADRMLARAPNTLIAELVAGIGYGGERLDRKLRTEDLTGARRLAYVATCALNPRQGPIDREPDPPRKVERDFLAHEHAEMAKALAEASEPERPAERPTLAQVRSWRSRMGPRPAFAPAAHVEARAGVVAHDPDRRPGDPVDIVEILGPVVDGMREEDGDG